MKNNDCYLPTDADQIAEFYFPFCNKLYTSFLYTVGKNAQEVETEAHGRVKTDLYLW